MTSADQAWLRVLLALAVTILLSVLPFKAPSVTPFVLQSLPPGPELQKDTAPVLRDAAKLDQEGLNPTHQSLKVAKKSNRKHGSADLDLAAGSEAAFVMAAPFKPSRLDRRDAPPTRPPPRLRLRAPPVLG
ncbi:hypothetical protein D3C72_137340 [compost metagenome]